MHYWLSVPRSDTIAASSDERRLSAFRERLARASPAAARAAAPAPASPVSPLVPRVIFPPSPVLLMAHAVGANPNGADPPEELMKLFTKRDLDATVLEKLLAPKGEGDVPLATKVNSPEKFWKVGVSSDKCYTLL